MTDKNRTMREVFEDNGFNPDELTHPRDVDGSKLTDDSRIIAYTCVRNPDPDGPATTWDVREFEIEAVVPTAMLEEHTDGDVSYPDDTPVEFGVIWSYKNGAIPNVLSIGYGDGMYGSESDFDDPMRWERKQSHVLGLSDDFCRVKV